MKTEPLAANVYHMLIAIDDDVGIDRERLKEEVRAGEFSRQFREGNHTREGICRPQGRTWIGCVGGTREIATPSAARRHPRRQRSERGGERPLQASRGRAESHGCDVGIPRQSRARRATAVPHTRPEPANRCGSSASSPLATCRSLGVPGRYAGGRRRIRPELATRVAVAARNRVAASVVRPHVAGADNRSPSSNGLAPSGNPRLGVPDPARVLDPYEGRPGQPHASPPLGIRVEQPQIVTRCCSS